MFSLFGRRPEAPQVKAGEPAIAILLLSQKDFPVSAFLERLRKLSFAAKMSEVKANEDGSVVAFNMGDDVVGIGSMPARYPEVAATAWMFPEAAAAVQAHAGFVTATLTGGRSAPVERRKLLTRVVAAMAEEACVSAVYWGEGTILHRPDVFRQMTALLEKGALPIWLWLDMRVWRNENGTFNLATTGLNKFGRFELEILAVPVEPGPLREFAFSIATTLILDNPIVKDGAESGRFGNSVLRTYLKPSVWEGRGTVLQMKT